MSEEKIKIPIYTTGELNAIDNAIMTDFDNLVNTAIEQIYKDRECIALQKIIKEQQKEIEELEKYDYRKIKIDEKNKISSIHFTKEQLDLMNLGIALYVGIPKILKDTENEETDI